ncbi:hypothetical protein [uncultured Cetobacterium sp.]|uniref:hypothetical protein n=1 Tax=uncultured Cetobacterium sp. TaxID=527638 RepID=UPI00261EFCD3|nr:hypothetical protein [uncultured Cetobacterium sp.]
MSTGLTLEEARQRYREYLLAEEAILLGQEYETKAGIKLKKANLKDVQIGIKLWEERCIQLENNNSGGIGIISIALK